MSNHSFKKNFIMIALVVSSYPLCGAVQAEAYKATQELPGNTTKGAVGLTKAPSSVYTEISTGGLKDRSMPNNGLVTKASTANTKLNQDGVFAPSQNGQGATK